MYCKTAYVFIACYLDWIITSLRSYATAVNYTFELVMNVVHKNIKNQNTYEGKWSYEVKVWL